MNIFLWILQILLALHTLMGAFWKFTNTAEQTMPSLGVIPNAVWLTMSIIEILCSIGLILPAFSKSLGNFAPAAAIFIAVEMLIFTGIHLYNYSLDPGYSPIIYWLVVAAICAFIAYGRFVLKPF